MLSLLASACSRPTESAASDDEGLQKRLAGVWVCNQRAQSGGDIIDTIELAPGSISTAVHQNPNRKLGSSTSQDSGRWGVDHGFLTGTVTNEGETNTQGPGNWRLRILRLDDHELEVESALRADEFNFSTNRLVLRRQPR